MFWGCWVAFLQHLPRHPPTYPAEAPPHSHPPTPLGLAPDTHLRDEPPPQLLCAAVCQAEDVVGDQVLAHALLRGRPLEVLVAQRGHLLLHLVRPEALGLQVVDGLEHCTQRLVMLGGWT